MRTVSIHEAKTHLSALVSRVQNRQEHIIICRYGHAVAELKPIDKKKRTRTDKTLSRITVKGDLTDSTVEEWEDA
ncbi:MAG: type II toxin-antitoxin system Phd/YefM family antitoxin [Kiritimatiellia bacterium]|nr:type II toxin-antitoxin system Phd/YefM family antitoxin [Kiritimatiellia bacterium]MDP6849168.1 type II toxin-antitoxin system Phd/YefM family antitoxin [Kiritimatiellia bacterium]